jgi:putative FmdB family regulatory protein
MPLYEYHCPQCGEHFEKLVPMSKSDEVECPRCHYPGVHRQISLVARTSGNTGGSLTTGRAASCATST